MKFLLLMVLIVGCGKNSMPNKLDLNDSDGDQIANEYEKSGLDKYVAKVVPMEEVEMELTYQQNHQLFSNKLDLQSYAKDLLVKNSAGIKANGYFSEFNVLRPQSTKDTQLVPEELVRTTLKFSTMNAKPKSIFVVYPDHKIYLTEWKEYLIFNLSGKILNAVLKGEAFFSVSNLSQAEGEDYKTVEESISLKTQRVVVYDGATTNVHYISKKLDLDGILKYLDIVVFQNIDEENLLQVTNKSTNTGWWIRALNNQDLVFVKDSAQNLAKHYLASFDKQQVQFTRVNGYSSSVLSVKKNAAASMLLRIRGVKKAGTFLREKWGAIIIDGKPYSNPNCNTFTQKINSITDTQQVEKEIFEMLQLNQLQAEVRALSDFQGPYWEIEVKNNAPDFQLMLTPFPANQYFHEGYIQDCTGKPTNYFPAGPNLKVSELSLTFSIEAFVEKI